MLTEALPQGVQDGNSGSFYYFNCDRNSDNINGRYIKTCSMVFETINVCAKCVSYESFQCTYL